MFTIEQQKMIMKNLFNKDEEETTKTKCLHDSCPQCGGTGVKKDGTGLCFHGISCPCDKCSPKC
ncbi:hypothetical protein Av05_0058 [Escherichia phage Av-05]|uniref:Uncharacterized protein n=1 Tax=Escherichia phage Av-05 TaxID=1527519 RepID=A0A076G5S7_9CAUD|nr:hypothetical protein Av05_0058 [Escherichia phage Av-05]AII27601.1 hypothetical protein Av05_0058 [Escherichia phage Av-05]